jgi:hypothetical protein
MTWEEAREVAVRQVLSKPKSNTEEAVNITAERARLDIVSPNLELRTLIGKCKSLIRTVKKEITLAKRKSR